MPSADQETWLTRVESKIDATAELMFVVGGIIVGLLVDFTWHLEPPASDIILVTLGALAAALLVVRARMRLTERRIQQSLTEMTAETSELRQLLAQRLDLSLEEFPSVLRDLIANRRSDLLSLETDLKKYKRRTFPVDDVYPELAVMTRVLKPGDSLVAVARRNLDDFTERGGGEYLAETVRRARDGVHVRRLFVLERNCSRKLKTLVRQHGDNLSSIEGSDARWLFRDELPRGSRLAKSDYVIFRGEVVVTQEREQGDESELSIDAEDIQKREGIFEDVWERAKSPDDLTVV
jgi:Family of unknown function (DUF6879)